MTTRHARGETTTRTSGSTATRGVKTPIDKGEKLPFDIDEVMRRIRAAVADVPDAAMFALRDLGYGTLFQQLVACIISIRTTDEVSLPTALALLKPGSLYIVDDMLPQANWPPGHEGKVAALIATLEQRTDVTITKLNWASGLIIVTKRHNQ